MSAWLCATRAVAETERYAVQMTRFESISASVPPGTVLPLELRDVCDELDRVGYPISGCMKVRADDIGGLLAWFGGDATMASQFAAFGAGPDGSLLAFWLIDGLDARNAPVVHLGSEGDHCMVLARSFREFLRLFAVGYDELGFDDLSLPAKQPESAAWLRAFVGARYGLHVPEAGADIVSNAQSASASLEAAIQAWFQRRYGTA
jgi:hypothetical protein